MTNDAWKPLPPETFDIPVHEIRRGYRSDVYFWRSKVALENARQETLVLLQVFQKGDSGPVWRGRVAGDPQAGLGLLHRPRKSLPAV